MITKENETKKKEKNLLNKRLHKKCKYKHTIETVPYPLCIKEEKWLYVLLKSNYQSENLMVKQEKY